MRRESFKFCELVHLILEISRYMYMYMSMSKHTYGWAFKLFLSATTRDAWIISSFQFWGYVLHVEHIIHVLWWHHQMETFSTLMALCVGNSPVTAEFPSQRPVTWSFDVFFDLCLNKPSWSWWFEMPPRSLWCHCNGLQHELWPIVVSHPFSFLNSSWGL